MKARSGVNTCLGAKRVFGNPYGFDVGPVHALTTVGLESWLVPP